MIGALARVGSSAAVKKIGAAAFTTWMAAGGAGVGAGPLAATLGVLRVASTAATIVNLPETLSSLGIGASNRIQDVKANNAYDELSRKYEELKRIYKRDTGREPPVY
jgi:hypothetical protein